MKKAFLLDTNILVHDPQAFLNFDEHDIIIPMTLLEELDSLKDRKADVSHDARMAIRCLEEVLGSCSAEDVHNGVQLESNTGQKKGRISVFNDNLDSKDLPLNDAKNDNIIINAALYLQKVESEKTEGRQIVLVTKDINMKLKAKSAGVEHVEDYKTDQVLTDADLMNTGYIIWEDELDFWSAFEPVGDIITNPTYSVLTVAKDELIEHPLFEDKVFPNAYILDPDREMAACIKEVGETLVTIELFDYSKFMNQTAWGTKPKCHLQAAAYNALMDERNELVTITGGAGSGKTFAAVVSALQLVLEYNKFDKIIVTRSMPPIAEEIGFLPGDESQKSMPWLQAITDTLEALHNGDENATSSIEYIIEKANIQFKSINFVRGRSYQNTLIILDEIQNLTSAQIKTILTRVGEGSRIFALGNTGQCDVKYLTKTNNGAVVTTETFKHFDGAANITLENIVRGRLAEFAEKNL